MNITLQKTDELNAVITVNIKKEDVAENVEKALRDYKRKAQVPGFRPGMVPMGLVKKMYGDALMAEELNKKISESLNDYLSNEKLNILGDPLPSNDQQTIDFNTSDDYNFLFDVAMSPEFEIKLSKRDKINYYKIDVTAEMLDKQIDHLRQRFGNFAEAEKVSDNSMLRGCLTEADEEFNPIENGVHKHDANMYVGTVKDDEIKQQFLAMQIDGNLGFNLRKAFPNDTELSSLLGIDKKELAKMGDNFRFTLEAIRDFNQAELNPEFFEKVTQNPEITTEEAFRAHVKTDIEASLVGESDYRFKIDAKNKILSKLSLPLPEDFLKRWLLYANKELTQEQLDRDFSSFADDLRWTLIVNKILKENAIEIQHEDLLAQAKNEMLNQFRQYGINQIPDETLEKYGNEMLQREKDAKRIYEFVTEQKALEFIKSAVKLEENLVSTEEFDKLFA